MAGSRGAGEVEELRRDLERERAKRREYEALAGEFEKAAAIAMEERDEALGALADAENEAQEEASALEALYADSVASLRALLGAVGGALRSMACSGEDADRLRMLASVCDVRAGRQIAIGEALRGIGGDGPAHRTCASCGWFQDAGEAYSRCMVGRSPWGAFGRPWSACATSRVCPSFRPFNCDPALAGLRARGGTSSPLPAGPAALSLVSAQPSAENV